MSRMICSPDSDSLPLPAAIPIAFDDNAAVYYSTRLGGSSQGDFCFANMGLRTGDDKAAVRKNRAGLAKVIGCEVTVVKQVHSAKAVHISELAAIKAEAGSEAAESAIEEFEADGIVAGGIGCNAGCNVGCDVGCDGKPDSTESGCALGVFAADCLPVIFSDAGSGIIAACHCGRRGLEKGIIAATVERIKQCGGSVNRLKATLGPGICGKCYEVGQDVAERFESIFPGTGTKTRFGGAGIDIAAAAKASLLDCSIAEENIIDSSSRIKAATAYLAEDEELKRLCLCDGEGPDLKTRLNDMENPMCTLENPLWFSHRRAFLSGKSREGRFLASVAMRTA